MPPESRFAIRAGDVAAKVIDGEAIVINVVNGRYHSLQGTAELVWSALTARPATPTEVARLLSDRYDVTTDVARVDVEMLLGELVAEKLVQVIEDESDAPIGKESWSHLSSQSSHESRTRYARPVLETFTDMEDLLAFDPPLPAAAPDVW